MFEFLDDFATVIYQGFYRFCLYTKVNDEDELVFHVGSVEDARWWKGVWTEEQVTMAVGSKLSGYLLEMWCENVQKKFVEGELALDMNGGTPTSSMEFIIDPSKQALRIKLHELSTEEAVKYTASLLYDIPDQLAVQAQSRQCRLNPGFIPQGPQESAKTPSPKKPRVEHQPMEPEGSTSTPNKPRSHAQSSNVVHDGRDKELDALKAQLRKEKAKNARTTEEIVRQAVPTNVSGPAVTKRKGGSLHNPTKKARKYKPIDYGSD